MTPQKGGVQAFCALFQIAFFLTNKEGGRQANIQKRQSAPTIVSPSGILPSGTDGLVMLARGWAARGVMTTRRTESKLITTA